MTVSISKMSINYYLEHAATGDGQSHDLTAYYTETKAPPGTWLGSGLTGLSGLHVGQEVTEAHARSIYELQEDPITKKPIGRPLMKTQAAPEGAVTPAGRPAKKERDGVAGFDLTFSPPKSVSALWALAGPELQGRLHAAHRQALEEILAWAEANIVQSRAGHGGVAHVAVNGVIASAFDHWDSRAGDPQLHTHLVIANRVQRASDGHWVTIDSYTLHRHVVALSEMYNSLIFDRLAADVGTVAESRGDIDLDVQQLIEEATQEETSSGYEPAHRVELAGIPDELIEEFSSRSISIEARTDELIAEYTDTHGRRPTAREILIIRQRATLENRPDKETVERTTLPEKMHWWRQRTHMAGLDPDTVVRNAVGHHVRSVTAEMVTPDVIEQISQWTLTDASQRRTTFSRANVRASAERVLRLVRCPTADDRHALVDQIVNATLDKAVSLTPDRSRSPEGPDNTVNLRDRSIFDHQVHSGVYTTEQVMTDEEHLISRVTATGAPTLSGHPDHATVLENWRTDDGHALSPDQMEASKHVLSSDAGISAIIGPAGTGKSTTMGAITDTWHSVHGDQSVIGLAPSAVAAGVLGDEIGVDTDNVAKWLFESVGEGAARRAERVVNHETRLEAIDEKLADTTPRNRPKLIKQREAIQAKLAQDYATQAQYRFHANQLIIIDEASMVSTTNMAELSRQAEAAGAKLLIVGDPAQLEAVDAGGFLGHVERHLDHTTLNTIWRFKNEWEKAASLKLRSGDIDNDMAVVDEYAAKGRIHGDPDAEAADTAYTAWKNDRDAGLSSILIASDNETVAELNQRAHTDLVESGDVDITDQVVLRAEVQAGVGDVLLARRNDRSIRDSNGAFVANGTRMTIATIRPDGSVEAHVQSDEDGPAPTIILDADYLASSVELGYATTAHRSQGVTVDTGHAVVTPKLSRELFYVAMTRGKRANHAYVDIDDPENPTPDDWSTTITASALDDNGEVIDDPSYYIKAVVARSTAEKSAHEVRDAELGWANDVGRICHELTYLNWAAKVARTQDWLNVNADNEHRERLRSDENWQRLISVDPAQNFHGEVLPGDSALAIIDRCEKPSEQPATGAGDMIVATSVATEEQGHIWDQAMFDLDDQVAARRAVLAKDPPEWFATLNEQYAHHPRRDDVINAVIVWRGVSNQTEIETPLGTEPPKQDYLRPYWERMQAVMNDHSDHSDRSHQPPRIGSNIETIDWNNHVPSADYGALDDLRLQTAPHRPEHHQPEVQAPDRSGPETEI
ncbi:MobF family relaxase [Brevibacterium sp. SMBL_HHYL_HB1]|jgi:conjugative relaxase-like TrwC/TraI family protein|uniref:MobF family relaxase n=1 Tax=Brevibacterium sp. SMBL_HHYL_HB1 TaxID=2777556 RepID=UPI001BADC3B6|nr:MobF family relaxase [Brevibacterium sp. SMBL_HHYL_HB1]QUL78029.1 relaxase domain-containing protein [Brevibacterium sp. SMBL_HHYL_HB1]